MQITALICASKERLEELIDTNLNEIIFTSNKYFCFVNCPLSELRGVFSRCVQENRSCAHRNQTESSNRCSVSFNNGRFRQLRADARSEGTVATLPKNTHVSNKSSRREWKIATPTSTGYTNC